MRPLRAIRIGMLGAAALLAPAALAQDPNIAPMPDSAFQRITPVGHDGDADIFSTRPVKKEPGAAPVAQAPARVPAVAPSPAALPPAQEGLSPLPWQAPAKPPLAKPNNPLPDKIPFGRAERPIGVEIPSGPHTSVAVPVGDVDAVEVSEPAPPVPVADGADPVREDATAPTEFSSPIFEGVTDSGAPRRIVFRVLNKVTAQASLFKAKPGEDVTFGKLQVNAIMCRVSAPASQTDSAGLLDIREMLPGKDGGIKPLFRGWMYTSSPSITGLEHPIYDVTMVGCEIADAMPKAEEKTDKKADKAASSKKKK